MAPSDDILQLNERRWTAQIGEDSAAIAELFANGFRYTHSTGSVDTKDSYERDGRWQFLSWQSTPRAAK